MCCTCLWFAMGSSLSFLFTGGGNGVCARVCACVHACVCVCVVLPHREMSARSEPVAEWFCQPAKLSWITLKWAPGVCYNIGATQHSYGTIRRHLLSFPFHPHPKFPPLILYVTSLTTPCHYLQEVVECTVKHWTWQTEKSGWQKSLSSKPTPDLCTNAWRKIGSLGITGLLWENDFFFFLPPSKLFRLFPSVS